MVVFEPGFDVTLRGVSFVARVDGRLVACWVPADALAEKEGLPAVDSTALRKIFKRYEELIRDRMAQKIARGASDPDRTFCLRSGEFYSFIEMS